MLEMSTIEVEGKIPDGGLVFFASREGTSFKVEVMRGSEDEYTLAVRSYRRQPKARILNAILTSQWCRYSCMPMRLQDQSTSSLRVYQCILV